MQVAAVEADKSICLTAFDLPFTNYVYTGADAKKILEVMIEGGRLLNWIRRKAG
jgi:hypothetical protein